MMGGIILSFCRKQLLTACKEEGFIALQSKTMSIFHKKKKKKKKFPMNKEQPMK